MRGLGVLAIAVVLAGCLADAPHDPAPVVDPVRTGPTEFWSAGIHPFTLQVEGQPADGVIAVPDDLDARTLVVMDKGLLNHATDFQPFFEAFVQHDAIAVAMEFRGPDGTWKAMAGAQDTVAATLAIQASHPDLERTILWGFSLGGEVSGMAVAMAPPRTYTEWLASSGDLDLSAMWVESVAFRPLIEAETGGTPMDAQSAYDARSPIRLVDRIAESGVERVWLVQGVADTIVPVNQAIDLQDRLVSAGVASSLDLITTGPDAWACTAIYVVCPVILPVGPTNHEACCTGHILDLLAQRVYDETARPPGTYVVDRTTGTIVPLD